MLLAVNVGNTYLKLALYRDRALVAHWVTATARDRPQDEYAMLWQALCRHAGYEFVQITGVAIACVVLSLSGTLGALCQRYLRLAQLGGGRGICDAVRSLYGDHRVV